MCDRGRPNRGTAGALLTVPVPGAHGRLPETLTGEARSVDRIRHLHAMSGDPEQAAGGPLGSPSDSCHRSYGEAAAQIVTSVACAGATVESPGGLRLRRPTLPFRLDPTGKVARQSCRLHDVSVAISYTLSAVSADHSAYAKSPSIDRCRSEAVPGCPNSLISAR